MIRKLPGVTATRVGYSGGAYRMRHTAITVRTRKSKWSSIRPSSLTGSFSSSSFQIHDPTTKNRQGNDIGTSYRSGIYYLSDEQRRVAEETVADV
ncbi:MAG: peptide-methionine (S)-S-oxide reductase, partial [Gammaproteobacteria bacterium]